MTKSYGGDDGARGADVSVTQRMLSAISGSLLTSLLVTPLDVVRVRLQSQTASSGLPLSSRSSASASTSASARSFANLPPNLGVSACCREVFWVNNNTSFCIATPSSLTVNPSAIPSSASTIISDCAADEAQRRTFTSTFDGLKKIARHEGFGTLWRGLSPTLVMAVPANVIYFTGYDWLRFSGASPLASRVSESYAPLVAGSVARIFAAMTISPIEMFRTRLQAASLEPSSKTSSTRTVYLDTFSGLRELTRLQGYTSLWRGLSLTLWRDVPFSGLYWWGYETIHATLKDARRRNSSPPAPLDGRAAISRENHTATLVDSFTAGAVSGALAAVVTTPFDVGKTRQQVLPQSGDASLRAGADGAVRAAPEPQSMPRFLWHIFRAEGLAGLWKGWAARCLKVAPACAIMISSYEVGKKMARGMNEKDG